MHADQVCVVAAGVVTPGCDDVEELWRRAQDGPPVFGPSARFRGLESLARLTHSDTGEPYELRFGEVPAATTDDAGDLQVSWLRRALHQCVTTTSPGSTGRTGLFLASSTDTSYEMDLALAADALADQIAARLPGDRRDAIRRKIAQADPCAQRGHAEFLPHHQAVRAAKGLLPPGTRVLISDNICPSALYSVDLGVRHLLDGEVDIAFCGGVSSHGPLRQVYFGEMGTLSRAGQLRAFDAAADGTVFSEGAGIVALKRMSDALRDNDTVLAVLAGFGAACDGKSKAIFAPSQEGQTRAMTRARDVNGVAGAEVAWIIGHGTATLAGDATELRSIAAAHPGGAPWITGNKAMLGHTGMACGIVSLIQAAIGLHRSTVPRQPNHTSLPEYARSLSLRVPAAPVPLAAEEPSFVGVFACGLGGINGHQLLYPAGPPTRAVRSAPPASCDELVLVRWSALLPGKPEDESVADQLARGGDPTGTTRFEDPYPLPPFASSLIVPKVAAQLDVSQLLTAELAGRLAGSGDGTPLWEGLEERTGVFGARYGVSRSAVESTVRCLGDGLAETLDGEEKAAAEQYLRELRDRGQAIGPYSLVGRMSSIALGWVGNRRNLRGPTMMVDAGEASGLAALHTAGCYLRRGDIDLALVMAWNTDAFGGACASGSEGQEIAEGAFGVAIARPYTAAARGWQVLARVRTELAPTPAAAPPRRSTSYLAADGVLDVIRGVVRGALPQRFSTESGPTVHVLPPLP
ncbi:beta-ketoacyl synthase N-terminal-like domain-containing protein [Nocardia sp. NRRL S-836]|uniref:beta-ketoacyl synthase N-terminal-like domain-containing protein n=1 Tax=Nocardia sp. NRRL S-836 TaxID=1519492 RepID=UPI000AA599DE|nr:beta-ketoacyl synthase N-terminal-like domain-containing protein [Nocardia sp. NRRL S-836]